MTATDGPARPRDPARGLRAIAAVTLALEAVVVLLAMAALHGLGRHGAVPYVVLLVLAGVLVAAAATQRRAVGRWLGSLAQVGVFVAGLLAWPLFVLGVAFGGIWVGYLVLRSGLPAR